MMFYESISYPDVFFVSLAFRKATSTDGTAFFTTYVTSSNGVSMDLDNDGGTWYLLATIGNGSSSVQLNSTALPADPGTSNWHTMAMLFDFTDDEIRFWYDGDPYGTASTTLNPSSTQSARSGQFSQAYLDCIHILEITNSDEDVDDMNAMAESIHENTITEYTCN